MKLKPLKDRIILKMEEVVDKTSSGLLLSASAKEEPSVANVLAIGSEFETNDELKGQIKVGDRVLFSKYAGTKVKVDGEEYVIVKFEDVLAVLE